MQVKLPSPVQALKYRQIPPDQTHTVKQGTLHLWYFASTLIGELVSGTIHLQNGTAYVNTTLPQEIADDIYAKIEGDAPALAQWDKVDKIITSRAAQALTVTAIPISSITHACRQGHIRDAHKAGRDWTFREGEFWHWLNNRPKPGRKGGNATSDSKQQAARENGKRGGRPRKQAE